MKLVYERTYETIDTNMTDAQIGARKHKSVRNHLFVLNSIISDVMSSKKKESIDLNVMDFKQMFDAEEIPHVLNAFYEAGIQDDMLSLLNEANKSVSFVVKTPNGKTEQRNIKNKIMQGDVMAPILSSNFVDVNVVKMAMKTGNVYKYKNKVVIPPLIMQDDTLSISACGYKTNKMNTLLNTCSSIMGLQFGSEKCVKMHIGKNHNKEKCGKGIVDSWKTEIKGDKLEDIYEGKVEMKTVSEKKYLGDIVSSDMKNEYNIRDKTNKATGNVNKIISSLQERPFGKHHFKAAKILRDGMLVGSLLNNAETWINLTKKDMEKLEKPDFILQEKLFSVKASKAFQYLEFGILPAKYVIMGRRLKFWKYILNEGNESMIRQVYEEQKKDSKKGDFNYLIKEDMKEIKLEVEDEHVRNMSKVKWKTVVNEKVEIAAFAYLMKENQKKQKTNHIKYEKLEMNDYLIENQNTMLSKTIYSIRAGVFDVKAAKPWMYEDNLCVACNLFEETMQHFMTCEKYETQSISNWEDIYENESSTKTKVKIAKEAISRKKKRDKIIQEDGLASSLAPPAPF